MRANTISIEQQLVNKINAKIDFTYPLLTERYIVGMHERYKGTNPSLEYTNVYKDVYDAVKSTDRQETFGGWLDTETNEYCVDAGLSFYSLDIALDFAKSYSQKAIYDTVEDKVIFVE
jgi:hypothetical protein